MNNKQFGSNGEDMAVAYLRLIDHDILARNYKKKFGEIDIISMYDDTICFIEVKTRTSTEYGLGREAVTLKKQRRIKNAANAFIKKNDVADSLRFDVIDILMTDDGASITYIENAYNMANIN